MRSTQKLALFIAIAVLGLVMTAVPATAGPTSPGCFGAAMAASTQEINQYYAYFAQQPDMQPGSWGTGDIAGAGDQIWWGVAGSAQGEDYTGDPIGLGDEIRSLAIEVCTG